MRWSDARSFDGLDESPAYLYAYNLYVIEWLAHRRSNGVALVMFGMWASVDIDMLPYHSYS